MSIGKRTGLALTFPNKEENDRIQNLYKTLIDTRNFEINLFWQRSNYFLVLNAGIALGFFNLKDQRFVLAMAVAGLISSILWLRVSLGAKYWQACWEHRLHAFENENLPGLEFFSASKDRIRDDAEQGLGFFETKPYSLKRLAYMLALRKPSVTFSMILLAMMFIVGWLLLIGFSICIG